jgi:hypothetical protein
MTKVMQAYLFFTVNIISCTQKHCYVLMGRLIEVSLLVFLKYSSFVFVTKVFMENKNSQSQVFP